MATLEEIQRWARGEHVEGLPERKISPRAASKAHPPAAENNTGTLMEQFATSAVAKAKKPKAAPPPGGLKYKVSADGTDALLHFGKHRGSTLTIIHAKDKGYLVWLGRQDWVPSDLLDVIKYILPPGI